MCSKQTKESNTFDWSIGDILTFEKFNTALQQRYQLVQIFDYNKVSEFDKRPYYVIEHINMRQTLPNAAKAVNKIVFADIPRHGGGFLLEFDGIFVTEFPLMILQRQV